MVLCIFIASSVNNLSPLATLAPTLTAMDVITPGMGAATCIGSAGSALGRALALA